MPCRDYDSDSDRAADRNAMKANLDKVTRLLCGLLTKLEADHNDHMITGEVAHWWIDHKKADRLEQQRIEKQAMMERGRVKGEIAKLQLKLKALGGDE